MKARFNYDLTEVMDILALSRALNKAEPTPEKALEAPALKAVEKDSQRLQDRKELIDRVEQLTRLMEVEREKARGAQSNLEIVRALNLLKAS